MSGVLTERWIICEGYHDRSFWTGLLCHLGCIRGDRNTRDPWGLSLQNGAFAFSSPSQAFIRVVPAGAKSQVLPSARKRLDTAATRAVADIVLSVDSDAQPDGMLTPELGLSFDSVVAMATRFDANAVAAEPHVDVTVGGQPCRISVARWHASDPSQPGLPVTQTLERLVCAAILAAFPDRAMDVQNWLDSRHNPPEPDPKEHALSYLAGWYAKRGSYQQLCEAVWEDERLRDQLRTRLQACGIWEIAERIAR